jgi:hypothetical protein
VPAFSNQRRTFEIQVNGQLTANELPIAITAAIDAAGVIQIMLPRILFFLCFPSRRQIRPPLKALVNYLRKTNRRPPAAILKIAKRGTSS